LPLEKNIGVQPTAPHDLAGLLTPPGMIFCVSLYNWAER